MATSVEQGYFIKARRGGRPVVDDLPKFDVEAYIANYKGIDVSYREDFAYANSSQAKLGLTGFYSLDSRHHFSLPRR